MRVNNLAIALYYESDDAGYWSLQALAGRRGVISPTHYNPSDFYGALGSLRCYSERFMCFLETGEAGELVEYVRFLLESLISLAGIDLASEFPEVAARAGVLDEKDVLAALLQEDQSTLLLQPAGECDLTMSFLNAEGVAPAARLSRYFRDLVIDRSMWQAAACVAIDEYMRYAEERLAWGSSDELESLVRRWKKHRSTLTPHAETDMAQS